MDNMSIDNVLILGVSMATTENIMETQVVTATTEVAKDVQSVDGAVGEPVDTGEILEVVEPSETEEVIEGDAGEGSDSAEGTDAVEGTDAADVDTVLEASEEGAIAEDGMTEEVNMEDMSGVDMGINPVMGDGGMEGIGYDGAMGTGMEVAKDQLLSSWPAVIGISGAVLLVSILLGALLARIKIKKGIDLYED